jgi:hypothetical protein
MPADGHRSSGVSKGNRIARRNAKASRRTLAATGLGLAIILCPFAGAGIADSPEFHIRLAQVAGDSLLRVTLAPAILAEPASRAPLEITIAPAEAVPNHSFLRLKGLPPTVSLSDGHAIAPGAWAIPLNALANLHINVPAGASGRSEFTVSLVGENGTSLAEATAALIVAPVPAPVAPAKKSAAPPPVASAPAQPKASVLSPADREHAEKLVARGERELENGNIAMARQFFLRAAEAGLARGALLLAATYDPRELARMRVQGVQPNPELARQWYERARALGAPEAEERLARLGAG